MPLLTRGRSWAAWLALLALAGFWLFAGQAALAQTPPDATPTAPPVTQPAPTAPSPVIVNIQIPPSGASLGGSGGSADTSQAQPLLNVVDYRVDPNPLKSASVLTLTVTVKNAGTKHADAVSAMVSANSSFVGLGAPAELGKLEPDETRTFSLLAQAGSLTNGAYTLDLKLAYRVGDGPEQSVVRSIGLRAGSSGAGVAGRPQVVVQAVSLAAPPDAGGAFPAQVVVKNVGQRKAYDVSLGLQPSDALSPAQGSGSAHLGDLGPGQAITHTVTLVLDRAQASGRVSQTFKLNYRDPAGQAQAVEETASLDLGPAGRHSPHLIVSGHGSQPERPAPGETYTLTVQITNVGSGPARRVLARLGAEGDQGLKPFLPLASSNVAYLPEIASGQSVTLTLALLVDGAAAGGAYPLPVALEYENAFGDAQTEKETLGVLVLARPQLQITLTKPLSETVAAGQTFDVGVEVVNVGRQRVDVNVIEIVSQDLTLARNSLFVGPLDPSISGGLTAKATAQAAGPAAFKIIVHYRDELNQMQTVERVVTLQATAAGPAPLNTLAPVAPGAAAAPAWWQMVLGFFGMGG